MTKENASASVRNGFFTARLLQNVDRDVHDDPHYVYEVPIDPGHLHSEVVVRGGP